MPCEAAPSDSMPLAPESHPLEESDSKEAEEEANPNLLFDYGTYLFQLQNQLKTHYAWLLLLSAQTPIEDAVHHRATQKAKEWIASLFLNIFGNDYDRLVDKILELNDLESHSDVSQPSSSTQRLKQNILEQTLGLSKGSASCAASTNPDNSAPVGFEAYFTRWNQFVSEQLEQLHYWNNVLQEPLDEALIPAQQRPDSLLRHLQQSFQSIRVLHQAEQHVHDSFCSLINIIERKLSIRFGHSTEHGTQVIDYLMPGVKLARSDFDIMTQIIVDSGTPQAIQKILNFLNQMLDSSSAHAVLISQEGALPMNLIAVRAKSAYGEQHSFHIELEFCDAHNNYKVDWVISNRTHQQTLHGRILPIAMMAYNLRIGTVFSPINPLTEHKRLLEPSSCHHDNKVRALTSEEEEELMNTPSAIAFIIRTMGNVDANVLSLSAKTQELIKVALKRTELNPLAPYSGSNCLTVLFGKPSLNIARFHQFIIDQQLVCIFQLERPEHRRFLNWINERLQRLEQRQKGATRCYVGLVSSIEYVALMLTPALDLCNINHIYQHIALRCLAPRFAPLALHLAQKIALSLRQGRACDDPIIIKMDKIFDLTTFYAPKASRLSAIPSAIFYPGTSPSTGERGLEGKRPYKIPPKG